MVTIFFDMKNKEGYPKKFSCCVKKGQIIFFFQKTRLIVAVESIEISDILIKLHIFDI